MSSIAKAALGTATAKVKATIVSRDVLRMGFTPRLRGAIAASAADTPAPWQSRADARLTHPVRDLSAAHRQNPRMTKHLLLAAALFFLLLAAALVLTTGGALAGDDDHLLAKRALEEGRVLPLSDILAKVKAEIPGKEIEVELEAEDGILIYELKMLRPDGRVQEVEVDAATGKILKVEDDN
jgi:uncharacterized membrane protein YkoI